jgi:hypothetical protein
VRRHSITSTALARARAKLPRARAVIVACASVMAAASCAGGPGPQAAAPGGSMGMPEIDPDAPLPTGSPGRSTMELDEIIPDQVQRPGPNADGRGAFRIVCDFSHMNYDDPIVYPGQPGRAHLHAYFGNTDVDASTTAESLATTGSSTCRGGIANRSSYWVPAMIDTTTGRPVAPTSNMTYYKTGYNPGITNADIQAVPQGLRMISGDQTATEPFLGAPEFSPQRGSVKYHCQPSGRSGGSIPDCAGEDFMVMVVAFPQCWDGVNLDSPDHRSHMAWPDNRDGCPDTHPVVLPQITMNVRYDIPAGASTSTWRLSSDMYPADQPGGYSIHADFFAGWEDSVQPQWLTKCVHSGGSCG